ncbi:MAG: alpha-N-arabinofuranosidase [Beutenbergiaceae bacterium]
MSHARIVLDRDFTIAQVPRRIFGSFVEHMGRCVYTGIYEPGHPAADEQGYRRDVLDLVTEMGPTIVRYPGGNFVSGHNWEDAVGPRENRPTRLDGAWHSVETNAFGLHEFMGWAELADVEVMETINLGTRGVDAARELVEYANHPGGTYLSDLRRQHGSAAPFDIKLWCLGNELDGPWQIGHKTAAEYGRLAQEAAKAMRLVDPGIELVAVGSSNSRMPTFGTWEQEVLRHTYDEVDYISLHAYYQELDGDAESFLASALDMDYFIESVISTADAVRAAGKHRKRIDLSFDEWNVWYLRGVEGIDQPHGAQEPWREHPRLIEDSYNVTDAVVVGTFLNSLLRHGDRVKIANQAQLVNVIAPIRSEPAGPAWRQSTFWPFARMSELARGQILHTQVTSDIIDTAQYGGANAVDVSATWDADSGAVALFLANRGLEEVADVQVVLRGFRATTVVRAEVLSTPEGGDRFSANTEHRQPVALRPLPGVETDGEQVRLRLPQLSWAVVVVQAEQA